MSTIVPKRRHGGGLHVNGRRRGPMPATPALAVSLERIDPRHAQPRHCPLPDFRTAALPPHEIFAFILLCMDAHAQAVNLPAVTGIVVYPHNVISAPDWPHPNAVGTVP
ncbi:hypothetical protein CBM2626_B150141 [Cupriavidus taiwanensis]|uniref:Uncharacterized protein n=1 Tax=Cupriavidus taiwanensis TaxID=164546 RepID=A0A976B2C2_9BURK|nr:hypothetical protein CBM2614_B210122 [Cupriavidus taiwanensis]SOZ68665.1 hypothetical protein CBM2615_B200122 [Cupriavidus taiwanensis]SOZ71677.1 hypothetical protein CBM2613_B180121 [Cupriavidus taiwanensis]SPA02421.1 hypothetical protein CBM2626_B150141 [Cupriavidus taiwanensis]SPA09460.1 hypothetical protein CBM2625_B180121 [Cupriavidus taiwanensis]